MIDRIEGFLSIPHELLHILGYRLVGKRCAYRWGDNHVTLLDPATPIERLIGGLFPFAVSLPISLFFLGMSGGAQLRAEQANPQSPDLFWTLLFGAFYLVAFIYVGACTGDLWKAYLLLKQHPHQTPEPEQHAPAKYAERDRPDQADD